MSDDELISINKLPCCPEVTRSPCCDRLLFTYRLQHTLGDMAAEVSLVFELERCPGALALGDVVYSTTLLPGERVRLYTSSRRNRFTYDSESEVSYRHEQTSEETFYMNVMDRFMSDLEVDEDGEGSSQASGSYNTEGSVSNAIETLLLGASGQTGGNFNADSSFDFARDLRRLAESSHERAMNATRAASSVSVGEVQTRTHAEGESESTFEAGTRTIENRNECHAVTYFAYQLVKRQTVRFKLKSVLRRLKDPAANTAAEARPAKLNGNVTTIPQGVLATAKNRLSAEAIGRTSSVADRLGVVSVDQGFSSAGTPIRRFPLASKASTRSQPLSSLQRAPVLEALDSELVRVGLLDKETGQVAPQAQAELGFEIQTCLPTPAVVVKGCLDECNVCEPSRQRSIELDLKRKALELELLQKQIELLERSQEYRCCPAGHVDDGG